MDFIADILRTGNVRLTIKIHSNRTVTYVLDTWLSRGLRPCEFTRAELRELHRLIKIIVDQVPGEI